MGLNRFIYDKVVRDSVLLPLVTSDYHPSYVPEKLRNIWTDYYYRSKYGADTGWGLWWIGVGLNKLYFRDYGDTPRTATIPDGWYDADALAMEIETQMEAQTSDNFYVVYSDISGKFTITDNAGIYTLTCTLTTNAIWNEIGFDTDADKTGSAAYNSDNMRIHNCAGFIMETGDASAISCSACALFGLNLTSSYQTLQLDRWTGSAWEKIGDFDYDYPNRRAILMWIPSASIKYRVLAKDWSNADRYFQCGAVVLGDYAEISRGYDYGASFPIEDTSVHLYSKKGYLNVKRGYIKRGRSVEYLVMAADEAILEDVYYNQGKHYPVVFVKDADDPENTMEYIIFTGVFDRTEEDAYFVSVGLTWVEVN